VFFWLILFKYLDECVYIQKRITKLLNVLNKINFEDFSTPPRICDTSKKLEIILSSSIDDSGECNLHESSD
jgi:hypothetical protein